MKNGALDLAGRIRRGEPIPWPLALLLQAATPIQRIGMWRRARQSVTRVPANVVSFGNITAGGTGKTPAVIARAEREITAGAHVAVLTRGYGSRKTFEPLVVHPEDKTVDVVADVGDEPALIRLRVPGVTLIKSADRVAGACAAIEKGADVILLDDGYQSLSLHRDENILCIDAVNPFGNGKLLPRGSLREPLAAMARATDVILTRCDQVDALGQLDVVEDRIRQWLPEVPIRRTRHAPLDLIRTTGGEALPLAWLSDREIVAACGIGHPEAFVATLEQLGARVVRLDALGNHGSFEGYRWEKNLPTLVTEKDAVRIGTAPSNALALRIALQDI